MFDLRQALTGSCAYMLPKRRQCEFVHFGDVLKADICTYQTFGDIYRNIPVGNVFLCYSSRKGFNTKQI